MDGNLPNTINSSQSTPTAGSANDRANMTQYPTAAWSAIATIRLVRTEQLQFRQQWPFMAFRHERSFGPKQ